MMIRICNKCFNCKNRKVCDTYDRFVYCIWSGVSCSSARSSGACFFRCSSYVPFDVSQEKGEKI